MNTTSPIHLRRPLAAAVVTALLLAVLALALPASTTEAQDQPSATITLEDTELVIYEKANRNTSRPSTGHFVDSTEPDEETYTIQLDSAPTGDVTVAFSIDKTHLAFVSPESLTFDTSNWSTPQTVTVESRTKYRRHISRSPRDADHLPHGHRGRLRRGGDTQTSRC